MDKPMIGLGQFRKFVRPMFGLRQARPARPSDRLEKSLEAPAALPAGLTWTPYFAAERALHGTVYQEQLIRRRLPTLLFRVYALALQKAIEKGLDGWAMEPSMAKLAHEGRMNNTEIEVAPGQTALVVTGGSTVLKGPEGQKVLLTLEPGMGGMVLEVKAKDRGTAEAFMKTLDGWAMQENFYKGGKIDANGRFLKLGDYTEDDLILPMQKKNLLFSNVRNRLEKLAVYQAYGIPMKRGILLHGPPGTGKTLAGKILAKNMPATFIAASPSQVRYPEDIQDLYQLARMTAPSIVMMEDVDTFGKSRFGGSFASGESSPMLGELLLQLDGIVDNVGVVTLVTTNHMESLDWALKDRPGRFDVKIEFGYPAASEVTGILERTFSRMKNLKYAGTPEELKSAAQILANGKVAGAHVVEVVNMSAIEAVERMTKAEGEVLDVTGSDLILAARSAVGNRPVMKSNWDTTDTVLRKSVRV